MTIIALLAIILASVAFAAGVPVVAVVTAARWWILAICFGLFLATCGGVVAGGLILRMF
jgi:hypothetical protein